MTVTLTLILTLTWMLFGGRAAKKAREKAAKEEALKNPEKAAELKAKADKATHEAKL